MNKVKGHKKEQRIQHYEEAIWRRLMEEYAEAEGARLLQEYKDALEQGTLPPVPQDLDARCQKIINQVHYYANCTSSDGICQ